MAVPHRNPIATSGPRCFIYLKFNIALYNIHNFAAFHFNDCYLYDFKKLPECVFSAQTRRNKYTKANLNVFLEVQKCSWWTTLISVVRDAEPPQLRGKSIVKTPRVCKRAEFQKPRELAGDDMSISFRRGSWSESTWQTCGTHGWEDRSQCSVLPFMSPCPSCPHHGHRAEDADTKFWHWSWVCDLAFQSWESL